MRTIVAIVVASSLVRIAAAEPIELTELPKTFAALTTDQLDARDEDAPKFAFGVKYYSSSLSSPAGGKAGLGDQSRPVDNAVIGKSADGKSVWIAVDIDYGCPGCDNKHPPRVHATGLFDTTTGGVIAWHLGEITPPSDRNPRHIELRGIAKLVEPGAEPLVALFTKSIGDPAAFAKTASNRADAVMYGNDTADRYVGGAKIAAQLAAWGFAFAVHGDLQAGLTPSKTTGWVGANVDASKAGTSTPYRMLAIYDKVGAGWQLVALHISLATENMDK